VCEDCAAGVFEESVGRSVCTGSCPTGKYSEVTGAISAVTCKECPIGTYGNTTGASSCAACDRWCNWRGYSGVYLQEIWHAGSRRCT
jgi:hypothetical protein